MYTAIPHLQVFETVEPCIKKKPELLGVLERLVEPVSCLSLQEYPKGCLHKSS